MHRETFGSGDDLVVVLGWGNRLDHENVRWLLDRLAETYRVHAFRIPDAITDFEREYVRPVERYVADLGEWRLLGHSTGGLIGPYVAAATSTADPITHTFLSPWWGEPPGRDGLLLDVLTRLPISRPILPAGLDDPALLGDLTTDRQLADSPDAAPTFLRETRRAHEQLPAIDDEAVVFCSLRDRVVGTRAIGERMPAERVRLYDGGHELFSSSSRAERIDDVLAAVREGPAGLD
ncbi:alpha/beta hydrolase [Natronoarchaeum mannanilyticum]|uniref:AB hydrolase-1 domain-containing protein n=1 Tax=Natronoarchaeum mannanilyticum TaxID=926360 RepID=A0AAV3T5H2_9EURY